MTEEDLRDESVARSGSSANNKKPREFHRLAGFQAPNPRKEVKEHTGVTASMLRWLFVVRGVVTLMVKCALQAKGLPALRALFRDVIHTVQAGAPRARNNALIVAIHRQSVGDINHGCLGK